MALIATWKMELTGRDRLIDSTVRMDSTVRIGRGAILRQAQASILPVGSDWKA